ncbi:MAG: MBL fold metallo-hydrolase [Candidatus Binatus sp.]|uniref:MBL fold metallo-hydrolase n=1 Tax=Candidatus Binatus sp. TaxID=2811406 RepID=UPI003C730AD2
MAQEKIALKQADRVEITTVLDNTVDLLLPSSEVVKRYRSGAAMGKRWLIAEHGFSAVVKVACNGGGESLLFDTGLSRDGMMHNFEVLGIKPREIQAIVLSHGHIDHTNGLLAVTSRLGRRKIPLVMHPEAMLARKVVLPDGRETSLPPPDKRALRSQGVELVEERGASTLLGGLVLITGQIPRTTEFEHGFPIHWAKVSGKWRPDPLINDDQAAVVNVRDKGLVILTGCGHAGLVNTIRCACELTGVERVHAVIGGFHLSGPLFEPLIEPTINALREFAPDIIVPAHCTGWRATHAIAHEFPEAFVQNSVGTRFVI